jgi:hypothetical protein
MPLKDQLTRHKPRAVFGWIQKQWKRWKMWKKPGVIEEKAFEIDSLVFVCIAVQGEGEEKAGGVGLSGCSSISGLALFTPGTEAQNPLGTSRLLRLFALLPKAFGAISSQVCSQKLVSINLWAVNNGKQKRNYKIHCRS